MTIAVGGEIDSGIGDGGTGSHVDIHDVEIIHFDKGIKPGGDRWRVRDCRIDCGWAIYDGNGSLLTEVYHNLIIGGAINIDYSKQWRIESNLMAWCIEGHPDNTILIADNIFIATTTVDYDAAIFVGGDNGAENIVIRDNVIYDSSDRVIQADGVWRLVVKGNSMQSQGEEGIYLHSCQEALVEGNQIYESGMHAIRVHDTSQALIQGNRIAGAGRESDNTYDAIHLEGNSSRNLIQGNKVDPSAFVDTTRYGIDISAAGCANNRVVGNDLSPAADFGTAPLHDVGSGTIKTYPNHATYGDNFT